MSALNKLTDLEITQLKTKCEQLKRENIYLREKLNIAQDTMITVPNEPLSKPANAPHNQTSKNPTPPQSDNLASELKPTQKIALFRSLFHGRDNVYAIRWENSNGRSGYSPACANEWDRRVCRKPQIKCSACPHSQWLQISDQVIHDHLTGKHTIGIYALQQDETCYFLALEQLNQKTGLLDIRISQSEKNSADDSGISSSTTLQYPVIQQPLPVQIDIIKSNLLFIPFINLPITLINQIKKIAAFQNPLFYKAQAMRLSTYGQARVIFCAEEFTDKIGIPRGCEADLLALLNHYAIKANIIDETHQGSPIEADFIGELRPEQQKALTELLQHNYGILAATTAFGKTVVAAKLIAERQTNTLILVHRTQLLDQWRERLSVFLGIPSKDFGVIGGGHRKPTRKIDIATLQSLFKKDTVCDDVSQYGLVIADECHHLAALNFEKVMKKVHARYVLGLTATPTRKDGRHPIIFMQCGPIRFRVSSKAHTAASQINHYVHVRKTSFQLADAAPKISDIYAALANDDQRNEQIFNDVLLALENKRMPLLLTERTQHLEELADRFRKFVKHVLVLRGGMKRSDRESTFQTLADLPAGEERLILATGKYAGEGFDDPLLDTLFLALPISWQGTLQQYVGRLHRHHQSKRDIQVYDYIDDKVPLLYRMYQKRLKKYRSMGYTLKND